jgi:hypothetical protein
MTKNVSENKENKARREAMAKHVAEVVDEKPPKFTCSDEDWAKTPLAMRQHIWRRLIEGAAGIEKYSWVDGVRKYDEMAKASGTTLAEALEKYIAMETLWRTSPANAFSAMAKHSGLTPDQLLAQVVEYLQSPEYLKEQRNVH